MSKRFSNLFHGTGGASAKVWDDITPTQPNYPGTEIPRSFIIKTDGETLWVHANATEHMADYIVKQVNTGHSSEPTKLAAQIMLYDMQQSLSAVTKNGIPYGRIVHHGNWDFIISKPRNGEPYDAVIHAFIKK